LKGKEAFNSIRVGYMHKSEELFEMRQEEVFKFEVRNPRRKESATITD